MIDELKPHPAYKDSGAEWLGQVPAHWEGVRFEPSVTNVVEHTATAEPGSQALSVIFFSAFHKSHRATYVKHRL